MSLVMCGANYKTMSLENLETISLSQDEISNAVGSLAHYDGVNGAVVISTCNRVEAYVDARTDRIGVNACMSFFHIGEEGSSNQEAGQYYVERGEDAVRHLFRVVCSLDSQVLGEAQILGQVKNAFESASKVGTCTETLTRLFKDALAVGKRAQSETAIGRDSISLSTAAFKVAQDSFGDLQDRRILLVGAGQMAALMHSYIREFNVKDVRVTTRTLAHAEDFASKHGAIAHPFEELHAIAAQCDVVFTMTSSNVPVIEKELLDRARRAANCETRKLVIIDEAVPRDVQPSCADLARVELHNLETLGQVVDEGLASRMAAIGHVERLVSDAEECFLAWMQQRTVEPTIREMYEKVGSIVEAELERATRMLAAKRGVGLSTDEAEIMRSFGNAIMKKTLHGPTSRLRLEAGTANSYYYTGAARYLFGLDTYPPGCTPHTCEECMKGGGCIKGYAHKAPHASGDSA